MILRKAVLFLAAVTVSSTATAHAQFGAYGMFTVNRLSNIASSPQPTTPTDLANTRANTVDPLGGTGGVYYDFMKLGPVRLGADVRGSILTTKRGSVHQLRRWGGAHLFGAGRGSGGFSHEVCAAKAIYPGFGRARAKRLRPVYARLKH